MKEPVPAVHTVRLFPLSNVVLLPNGVLPLHIFEPRYRQMAEDALADDREFAMILPANAEEDPPPLSDVGCLGRIREEARLADGRFNLLLEGFARIRVEEEIETDRLYRMAKVRIIEDERSPGLASRRWLHRSEILRLLERMLPVEKPAAAQFLQYVTDQSPGAFADIVAHTVPLGADLKQLLLEEANVDDRLEALAGALEEIVEDASATTERFPPTFGRN